MKSRLILYVVCSLVLLVLVKPSVVLAQTPDIQEDQVVLIDPKKSTRILVLGEHFAGANKNTITIFVKDTNLPFKIQNVKLVSKGAIIKLKAPSEAGPGQEGDEIVVTVVNGSGETDTEDVEVVYDPIEP